MIPFENFCSGTRSTAKFLPRRATSNMCDVEVVIFIWRFTKPGVGNPKNLVSVSIHDMVSWSVSWIWEEPGKVTISKRSQMNTTTNCSQKDKMLASLRYSGWSAISTRIAITAWKSSFLELDDSKQVFGSETERYKNGRFIKSSAQTKGLAQELLRDAPKKGWNFGDLNAKTLSRHSQGPSPTQIYECILFDT